MNKRWEDRSLLEVREWKEQCRLEDQNLSMQEYIEKLQSVSDRMKAQYHIHLDRIHLSSANQEFGLS